MYRADGSVERCPIKASENGTGGNPGEGSESPEKAGNQAETRLISEERNPDGGILYRDYLVRPDVTGMEDAHRLFLCVDYLGDRAEVYEAAPRGRLLDDWFTTGKRWMIFLNRFGCPGELMIRIYDSDNTLPCSFSREVYYDLPVKRGCEILGAVVQAEYLADVLI